MYDTILRLYKKTKNESVVTGALAKGWITESQAEVILATE